MAHKQNATNSTNDGILEYQRRVRRTSEERARTERVNISLDRNVHAALRERAYRQTRSLCSIIEDALRAHLGLR